MTDKIVLPHLDALIARLSAIDRKQPTTLALGGQCMTAILVFFAP